MQLKGNYSSGMQYSVGDVVKFTDGVVYHLQYPAPSGVPPVNTRYWSRVDQTLAEAVRMVIDAMAIEEGNIPELANNLTTETTGKALDATQGKALKDLIPEIANNLTTETAGKALDATQGKTLKDSIPTNISDSAIILNSSTEESTKQFLITVDDTGELTVTEITEGGES